MENIREPLQEHQIIQRFISMPREALQTLIGELALHMTLRDLVYCQNQYRMREKRDPRVEEIRLLDAIYVHRTQKNERYGLRSFYTSDPMVAETYADMVAKASHIRREERPYTPQELSGVLTHSLLMAGRKISVPTLCAGEDAALRLLEDSYLSVGSAVVEQIPAMIGRKEPKLCDNAAHSQPLPTDQILLITPTGFSPAAFAATVAVLPFPKNVSITVIGRDGLLDALLKWDGIYLVQNYLPGIADSHALSALAGGFTDSLLIRVGGEDAPALRDAAAAMGLTASIIGKYTPSKRLTIRRDGMTPLQFETAFLRAFSPTLPVDAEIPGVCMQTTDNVSAATPPQTVIGGGDCALFATAIPGTPYTLQKDHLITGAVCHAADNTFFSSLMAALYAVNRAVAAGIDYPTLTLSHRIQTPQTGQRNLDLGQTMSALLGAYRVQAELALPDIGGCFADSKDPSAHLTVFAAAPKPENVTPHRFTAAGSNVYLLKPLSTKNSPVDFEDLRKLLRYMHQLYLNGIVLSAIAVGEDGVEGAVRTMTQNGYGFTAVSALPHALCGFLVETTQPIQGTLIGLTSSLPVIHIGESECPTSNYCLPHLTSDQIPMSAIGTAHPVLCLPLTKALGTPLPIGTLAEQQHAILRTVPLTNTDSRTQITEFANTMRESQITVLVGRGEEIDRILSNRRVQYAKRELLAHDGILLCLHTDRTYAENAAIPKDHPLLFGTPEIFFRDAAITFGEDSDHEVHMCADSLATPRMLACGIAYFQ